ncbi:MAG: hypothetical protein IKQ29_03620 [Bacilli bacterium]|nr:hypothetical protein [Bacilli bacterium]
MENKQELNFGERAAQFVKKTTATIMVAVTIMTAVPGVVNAEEAKTYKPGTFIEELMPYEESQYGRYVVKAGDNASKISEKICKYFGQPIEAKFWPVIAYLNAYPRIIRPGDIIIFPGTYEDMVSMLDALDQSGWTAAYKRVYKVYQHKTKLTVKQLIQKIYLYDIRVDDDIAEKYLKTLGLDKKYDIDSVITDNDMLFEFVDWIPTLEEIGVELPTPMIVHSN